MNVVLHPLYRRNYIGIARANALLALTELETPAVEVYKAEAKFLRAYYHFELFRHFGPIPWSPSRSTPATSTLSGTPCPR